MSFKLPQFSRWGCFPNCDKIKWSQRAAVRVEETEISILATEPAAVLGEDSGEEGASQRSVSRNLQRGFPESLPKYHTASVQGKSLHALAKSGCGTAVG